MRYDLEFLFLMVAIGLVVRRLSWRGWFGVVLLTVAWIMFNWKKG